MDFEFFQVEPTEKAADPICDGEESPACSADDPVYQVFKPSQLEFSHQEQVFRDGILLEKGVIITEDFLRKNEDLFNELWNIYTVYPDIYLDTIKSETTKIDLFPFQRLLLRAFMRYNTVYLTAARATSKSFLSVLAKMLQCIFIPGHQGMIVAPTITQAVKIAAAKINEIFNNWPLLRNEIEKMNQGKDYLEVFFKNGSHFSVVGAIDSSRGLRKHSVFLDEARDLDGDMIDQVILPQLNVSRRLPSGLVNPHEVLNQQIIYGTSAGSKSSYAYSALIDILERSIMFPKANISLGLDYRIPVMHGLIAPDYVQNLKMSPSYNEENFVQEYCSNWLGSSSESWFNWDKLTSKRKIKNPEWKQKYQEDGVFYYISMDVARSSRGDQSVVCVFRVNTRDDRYYATLVYIEVLGRSAETKTFTQQAIALKLLIRRYNPIEVLIDINGLGAGMAELMIMSQIAPDGTELPPYGFMNDDDLKKVQPKDAPQILFGMRGNGPLNSKIHSNAYTRINNGLVHFLVSEQDARAALMNTKVGQKMSYEDRVKRILPHETTTKLLEEMVNLRAKRTGVDVALEQINTHTPKDKYFAFAYGLWRIKELEEEHQRHHHRGRSANRQLVFFTGGA